MSGSRITITLWLIGAGACASFDAQAAPACNAYGQRVTLHGVLSRATFPEQPNFESIAAGDAPASYFFVTPDRPLCLAASRNGDDPAEFTDRLQLVFAAGPAAYASLRPSLARSVVCRGNLMHEMSGHHHAPVLLIDARCEAAFTATPESLRDRLDQDGADAALDELRRRPAVFEAAPDGIATAGHDWIPVTRQLLFSAGA